MYKTRRSALLLTLLSLSHSLLLIYLSLFLPLFFFLFFAPPLAEAGADQGRVQVLKLSLYVLLSVFRFLYFFYAHEDPAEYRVPRSFRVFSRYLLHSRVPPLFLLFVSFSFTKITEQHQHLFLLKPTLSSAGRPTKTEADHFFFYFSHSFTYTHTQYTHLRTRTHVHTHTHMYTTHKACIRTFSRFHKCARTRFPIAVSLKFGKIDALRFAPLFNFVRFVKYLFFFSPAI